MPAILAVYVAALVAGTILFGFNLAELNAPQRAIEKHLNLTPAQFGLASSILAIGGLFGSVIATPGMNALGRKKVLICTALMFGLGGLLKAGAQGAVVFITGRFVSGIAAGSAAVIVPIYINELAPPNSKGAFGALTQISINLGILSSQVLGIFLENNDQWRFILLIGGIVGVVQTVALLFVPESPSSLVASGDIEQARRQLIKIRGTPDIEEELAGYQSQLAGQSEETDNTEPVGEHDSLLEAGTATEPVDENSPLLEAGLTSEPESKIGLLEFVTKREYRWGFMIVAGVMLAQQLTGINSVVFYGVSILHDLLPNSAKYLNAGISGVNLLVTLGASPLFDRVNHKTLLLASMLMMAFFSGLMSLGILRGSAVLSALATLLFVSSFSIGLGPLPWMVASQRMGAGSVGAAQSIGLAANWLGTFLVGFAVPPIAHLWGMARVFMVFGGLGAAFFFWGLFCL